MIQMRGTSAGPHAVRAIAVRSIARHRTVDEAACARFRASEERAARAIARDEAAVLRDLRADEIDQTIATSDAPLDEKLAWLRVAAAGDRARAAVDRERAAQDRVDAGRGARHDGRRAPRPRPMTKVIVRPGVAWIVTA